MSIPYLLNQISSLKLPLLATEYYAYVGEPRIESIKLLTIIKAKMRQHGRKSTWATFH